MDFITLIGCLLIIGVFVSYSKSLWHLFNFINTWKKCQELCDIEKNYSDMKVINDIYQNNINIHIEGLNENKTTTHADEIYYNSSIARVLDINLKHINSAPGVISGLGILGTFIGLTIGIHFFNSDNSEAIMNSIQSLLGGMSVAFATSIVGMIFSSLYIGIQKKILNDFNKVISFWCNKLDERYYISEVDILRVENTKYQKTLIKQFVDINTTNKKLTESLTENLEKLGKQLTDNQKSLMEALMAYDTEGEQIRLGDMLQNLYEESEKQSQALESFTTDLSNELNSSLGKTMDGSIVPLIRDLENAHNVMNNKLESLSSSIKSPATDMVSEVISELKSSMKQITSEFKDSISTDTVSQMNSLAENLSKSSDVLNTIPLTMQMMSDNVSQNFSNVKNVISQLQSSMEEQQNNMIEKSRSINEAMSVDMKTKLDEIMLTISGTVSKLNDQQNNLIEGQGRSTREIERLLTSFDDSINKMKLSNIETSHTLVRVQTISEKLDDSATKLKELSTAMTETSNKLFSQQKETMLQYQKVQEANQDTVDDITKALSNTRYMIDEYSQQYETIKSGLQDIFAQINKGLQEYSATLRTSTADALSEYSNALANSTKGLHNIAEALNETAEELSDGVDKIKTRLR